MIWIILYTLFLLLSELHNYWINLATLYPYTRDFIWGSRCEPLCWSDWSGNEPIHTNVSYCGRMISASAGWMSTACNQLHSFMCEVVSSTTCRYSHHLYKIIDSKTANLTIISHNTTRLGCIRLCDFSLSGGEECWVVSFVTNETHSICHLYYCDNPYLVPNETYWEYNSNSTVYVKSCYEGRLGDAICLPSVIGSEVPVINCSSGIPDTSSFCDHFETTMNSGTSTMSTSSFTTHSQTVPITTAEDERVNTNSMSSEPATTMELWSSTAISSHLSNPATTEVLASLRTSADIKLQSSSVIADKPISTGKPISKQGISNTTTKGATRCYCRRRFSTAEEKEKFLQEILISLTLNTSNLSSVRRKYTSVVENRPGVRGIGFAGIIFIVLTLMLIFACDIERILRERNMRHLQ